MFVYVAPESYVPKDHPLRPIRALADKASTGSHFNPMVDVVGVPFTVRPVGVAGANAGG